MWLAGTNQPKNSELDEIEKLFEELTSPHR
jgi:hypothetical protein